jgi:hypothetical protein
MAQVVERLLSKCKFKIQYCPKQSRRSNTTSNENNVLVCASIVFIGCKPASIILHGMFYFVGGVLSPLYK